MSAVQTLNPKAQVVQRAQAFQGNLAAAKGLQEVLKTNLGPRGTLKMLVGGAGQLKLTKDGNVLLKEMQIQHPTAAMIARAATAQDEIVGDGTTSNVLFIGELLRQAEKLITEGIHPRIVVQGYELARAKALELLETFKVSKETVDRETLLNVARTSLRSKLSQELADQFTEIVVDAVLSIKRENGIDLHMVEIMHMRHQHASDSRLVKGLVLDHGSRHQDMPAELKSCFILTCNVNLEYEKTEVNSQFCFSNANQREKLFKSERKFVDDKVLKIIELKKRVCTQGQGFVVINQKGIDPVSLDLLAHENIIALRRAKRRNMERLTLACGGNAVNSVEELSVSDLGKADLVYEQQLGEEKFTFVEGVPNTLSCTILVKGPDDHTINQIKDAIRDGLRSVKNTLLDKSFVPGAGAFEISTCVNLKEYAKTVSGKPRRGIEAFADALMVIPRTLAENSGLDAQDCLLKLQEAYEKAQKPVGLDLENGDPISPEAQGILDNAVVKRQFLNLAPVLAQQLLLVDEVIKAGQQIKKNEE